MENEKKPKSDELEKARKEANEYKYKQSSKGSELIRKIVFLIIGSCWVLMFTKGKYHETNIFLKVTITCSFVYLLLDVMHYLWDTCSYHLHSQNLELCTTTDYLEHVYKPSDLQISKRSFIFFILKVIFCFIVSGAFLLGMFINPLYGKSGTDPSARNSLSDEKWERDNLPDGYVWNLYKGDPKETPPTLTIGFDNQSVVTNIEMKNVSK